MGLQALRSFFARAPLPGSLTVAPNAPGSAGTGRSRTMQAMGGWSAGRLAVNDGLWGAGYQFPGGDIEMMRLVKALALPTAAEVLLLGAGGGGPAATLAEKLGAIVVGFEADAVLAAAASTMLLGNKFARRTSVALWEPSAPELGTQQYHHCVALEPLTGLQPEPLLAAVAAVLKPGGQLMLVQMVADTPLNRADPDVAEWVRIEPKRSTGLPAEVAVTRALGRLGFDIKAVDDISQRHIQQALLGWRTLVRGMEFERPGEEEAAVTIQEAEAWLLRLRLFNGGQVRLVRWHATGGGLA